MTESQQSRDRSTTVAPVAEEEATIGSSKDTDDKPTGGTWPKDDPKPGTDVRPTGGTWPKDDPNKDDDVKPKGGTYPKDDPNKDKDIEPTGGTYPKDDGPTKDAD